MECCDKRNDSWSETVAGEDLFTAEGVYHKACDSHFRKGNQIPQFLSCTGTEPVQRD